MIVEVCHPQIVKEFGLLFLSQSHFMVRFFFFTVTAFILQFFILIIQYVCKDLSYCVESGRLMI